MPVLNLDLIHAYRVNSCPHNSSPTFGCSQDEECSHCLNDIVKVGVTVSPIVTCFQAVIFSDDPWTRARASVVFSFEETYANNCKYEQNENTNHDDIANS